MALRWPQKCTGWKYIHRRRYSSQVFQRIHRKTSCRFPL
jgi:hypothetical protein